MKYLALAFALTLPACTPAAIVAAIPIVSEIYGGVKTAYRENATDEGRAKVKEAVADGETLYRYCPEDKR